MVWVLIILVLVTVHVRVVQLLSLRSARIPNIPAVRTLLIDNFDSYTYNIFQLIAEVNGIEPIVVYNNALSSDWSKVKEKYIFDNIVLSPGPGNPRNPLDFGLCMEAITQSAGYPLLGVCLGHQGMVAAYGGGVVRAKTPMHGRLSALRHTGTGLFRGIPQGTNVVRYHSLAVQEPLPSELRATAWAADGTVMGLEHTGAPQYGVQFHPESVLTEAGRAMLTNFRDITLQHQMGLIYRGEKKLANRNAVVSFDDKGKRLSASVDGRRRQHVQVTAFPNKHNISTERVFERMFGAHAVAFWLDGECAGPQRLLGSVSDAASAAAGAPDTSPRLSYFGALDRAGAYAVEYLPEQRILKHTVVEAGNGSSTVTQQLPHGNIFQFLRDQLTQSAQTEVTVTCSTYGSIKTFSNKSALPFNMTEGYFGYLGYEVGHEAVRILTAQTSGADRYDLSVPLGKPAESAAREGKSEGGELPLAVLLRPVQYVVYDHTQSTYYAVQIEDAGPDTRPDPAAQDFPSNLADILGEPPGPEVPTPSSKICVEVSNTPQTRLLAWKSREVYMADIASCLESIRSGETYEVCLTQQFEGPLQVPPTPPSAISSARTAKASTAERSAVGSVGYLGAYKSLRRRNPAPYACYLRYDPDALRHPGQAPGSADSGLAVCSSSPECFLKAAQDGTLASKPIKGTARRDLLDPTNDRRIAQSLVEDEKSRAENLMIVDLVRNDLGRVCEIGSVRVPRLMDIESYATVHQMVSTVSGKLKPERDLVDALVATFPGGSMTGAPKVRTMEIIDKLEGKPRGIYSGSMGYIGLNGEAHLNIVIRTAVMARGKIRIGAGGAIVAMSDPDQEADEVHLKADAVARALGHQIHFPL